MDSLAVRFHLHEANNESPQTYTSELVGKKVRKNAKKRFVWAQNDAFSVKRGIFEDLRGWFGEQKRILRPGTEQKLKAAFLRNRRLFIYLRAQRSLR
jgi:hypothetical protein